MKSLIKYWRIIVLHGVSTIIHKLSIQSWSRVLIVAPHPDDEALGCSGLIQRLLREGKQVDIVILSGGGKSHAGCCHIEESLLVDSRRNLSRKATGLLGLPLKNLHFLNYPDGSISYDCPETGQLKNLIEGLQPDVIFVPYRDEGWSDHLAARDIVRKFIGNDSKIELYEYCVWFWFYNVWNIDWKNARILVMSPQEHKNKNLAIDAYILPKAPCGNPWSGVLPNVFVRANRWKKELYFKQSEL
ncbi:PIG-L family deacetylase [Alistipes sp. An66]|nr:PIG-L family deacetylase [Alistipes sp. An66]